MRLTPDGVGYICSYECTYCASCVDKMSYVCPNCGGELVRRPRRTSHLCLPPRLMLDSIDEKTFLADDAHIIAVLVDGQ